MLKTGERFLGILDEGATHYQKIFQSYPSAFAMAKAVEGWMVEGKDGELVYSTPKGDYTLLYSHEKGTLVSQKGGEDYPVRYYRMTSIDPPLAKWRRSAFSIVPKPLILDALDETHLHNYRLGPIFQTLFTGCVQSQGLGWHLVKSSKELDPLISSDDRLCLAFHGTVPGAADSIFEKGFDMSKCGTHGSAHGRGLYMTADWLTAKAYGKGQSVVVVLFRCTRDDSITSLVDFGGRMCQTKETVVVRHAKDAIPLGVIHI